MITLTKMALPVRRELTSPVTTPCVLITSPSSMRRSEDELHRIARKALQDHKRMCGNPLETPSVRSILDAYEKDGNGDTRLLIAILQAKSQEDEQVTAHYDLQAANLNHVRRPTKITIGNRSGRSQPYEGAIQRRSSCSSTTIAVPAPLATSVKRHRDPSDAQTSKDHDTVTWRNGKAPKAKIIRLGPLKISSPPSPSVKPVSSQSEGSFSGKLSAPLEDAVTCRPSLQSPPLEPLLTPRSSREGSMPAISDKISPKNSPVSSSLARLLNDPISVTPHSSP